MQGLAWDGAITVDQGQGELVGEMDVDQKRERNLEICGVGANAKSLKVLFPPSVQFTHSHTHTHAHRNNTRPPMMP